MLFAAIWFAALPRSQPPSSLPGDYREACCRGCRAAIKSKSGAIAPQNVKAGRRWTVTVTPENADAWKEKLHYSLGPRCPAGRPSTPRPACWRGDAAGPAPRTGSFAVPGARPSDGRSGQNRAQGCGDGAGSLKLRTVATQSGPRPARSQGRDVRGRRGRLAG